MSLLVAACAACPALAAAPKLMDWPDLLGRPMPAPTLKLAYGADPLQFGELWLPQGRGPHPLVLMVHGGCWRSNVARLSIMNYAAEDLRRRGYAVWNIEYRGIDRPGGGYPGTFLDVAAAADELRTIAPSYDLDLRRIVALGHSAGGHLVHWLAARPQLPAASPLRAAQPLPIAAVVSSGGLPDLAAVRALGDQSCGEDSVDRLVGPATATRPDPYADTSPAELPAAGDAEVEINGEVDTIAPAALGAAYAARMAAKGARIRQETIAGAGHVELIAPGTGAWDRTVEAIDALARR